MCYWEENKLKFPILLTVVLWILLNKLPLSISRLYDASKFRLASFKIDSNSVHIQIGITSYKVLNHITTYCYHKITNSINLEPRQWSMYKQISFNNMCHLQTTHELNTYTKYLISNMCLYSNFVVVIFLKILVHIMIFMFSCYKIF